MLEIGQTISHFRILQKIGVGGMGEVYVADDTSLDRKVALKFLPEVFTSDPERMARFEREARLLASLNHPNIAGIHGLEHADGIRFLVLEYVEGETLQARLSKGALPLEEALAVCRQIAEGLEEAHEKGVIHRDLKPANLMIAAEEKVKILDFGLAKALSDKTQSIEKFQKERSCSGPVDRSARRQIMLKISRIWSVMFMVRQCAIGVLFLFSTVQTLCAQPVLVGLKGGVPLTDAFQFSSYTIVPDIYPATGNQDYFSKTKRYTVGPTIELRLPLRLSLELDALYKHLNYDYTSLYSYPPRSSLGFRQNAIDRWEFPLLLKYRLPMWHRGLYLAAGPSLNYISRSESIDTVEVHSLSVDYRIRETSSANPIELKRASTGGIVVGGGWEFRLGILRISPELRYTRWVNRNFMEQVGMQAKLRSGQNQIEFLMGVMFPLNLSSSRN
jgi:serine/threonine protein kinase